MSYGEFGQFGNISVIYDDDPYLKGLPSLLQTIPDWRSWWRVECSWQKGWAGWHSPQMQATPSRLYVRVEPGNRVLETAQSDWIRRISSNLNLLNPMKSDAYTLLNMSSIPEPLVTGDSSCKSVEYVVEIVACDGSWNLWRAKIDFSVQAGRTHTTYQLQNVASGQSNDVRTRNDTRTTFLELFFR